MLKHQCSRNNFSLVDQEVGWTQENDDLDFSLYYNKLLKSLLKSLDKEIYQSSVDCYRYACKRHCTVPLFLFRDEDFPPSSSSVQAPSSVVIGSRLFYLTIVCPSKPVYSKPFCPNNVCLTKLTYPSKVCSSRPAHPSNVCTSKPVSQNKTYSSKPVRSINGLTEKCN